MNRNLLKDSMAILIVGALVVLALGLLSLTDAAHATLQSHSRELERIKQDIQVVKTLSRDGPRDIREVDLLQKLNGYCQELGIGIQDCQMQTQTPLQNDEYSALRYTVTLQNLLMDKTVDYLRKLESLPDNVRVSLASIRRMEARREGRPPFLIVRLEMNEIKFRQ